jgi:hypothetical protein
MKVLRAFVGLALVASVFIPRTTASAGTSLFAVMSGDQEVPSGSGDPNGTGRTDLVLKVKKKTICFTVQYDKIDPPTAGHIHQGDVGVDGPIVVTLFTNGAGLASGTQGCVSAKRSLIKEIRDHFTHFYVNFHNPAFPDGAIRGQLEI